MPKKEKRYIHVVFTPEVISQSVEMLESILSWRERRMKHGYLNIELPSGEEWSLDTEDEFFAEYRKGFNHVNFVRLYGLDEYITFYVYGQDTDVSVYLPSREKVERVFNVLESNVDKCRVPRQPKTESKLKTDWITETISNIESRCPIAGRKLTLALIKLDSEEVEEWQNATMLIRDAWIELSRWLCEVINIDTADLPPDAVIDRLKKLKFDKVDERLFNLARASFSLYSKHHKRDIDLDTAVACVISTVVSMRTVIKEVF